MLKKIFYLLLLALASTLHADDLCSHPKVNIYCPPSDLVKELNMVHSINQQMNVTLPIFANNLGTSGYFNMPSALMRPEGTLSFGYAWAPPYTYWNLGMQIFDRFEVTGTYRIYNGIEDSTLGPFGFGDYADRGLNFKIALLKPQDSDYRLPGIAYGYEDFLGSKAFEGQYIILTQVIPAINLEATLGWGWMRYHGLFGGLAWTPFHNFCSPWINNLTLMAEYDCTNYTNPKYEPHPQGRNFKTRVNPGIKYRLWKYFDLSVSYLRGQVLSGTANISYNFAANRGVMPKIKDPLPYRRPINTEPIGIIRPLEVMVDQLALTLKEQGFKLLQAWLERGYDCSYILRLQIVNEIYPWEEVVHRRITDILANLTPTNLSEIDVVIESVGLPCQQYRFRRQDLAQFADNKIGPYEMEVLSPYKDVTKACGRVVYKRNRTLFTNAFRPRFKALFGSATGKFKAILDLSAIGGGFLFSPWMYQYQVNYIAVSSANDSSDMDYLNPSQLLNVHSDLLAYTHPGEFTLEKLYLQRAWNIGKGWFGRFSTGYFETEYAGGALEFLYYPADSKWALGVEWATMKKRAYRGFGFQSQIRKFVGYTPTYVPYTVLNEYFLDFYYDFSGMDVEIKLSAGQFMAKDIGVRGELWHYFKSGVRIGFWYTITNGHDSVNGQIYYDKGIAFSIPLDFFMKKSSKERFGTAVSAWLRDVGYRASTGRRLHQILNEERRY